MLTTRQMKLIVNMPKAENHIHIEGSIPWDLALELGRKNGVKLPADTVEGLGQWVRSTFLTGGLNGFMICDRTINSVCLKEEDYEATVLALEEMHFTEDELIQTARNAFAYSIKGQKYLERFDTWVEEFRRNEA